MVGTNPTLPDVFALPCVVFRKLKLRKSNKLKQYVRIFLTNFHQKCKKYFPVSI